MSTEPDTSNLYQRIGGQEAIFRMVGEFYERILADTELAPFFVGRNMEKLRHMQHEFFSAALGGPINYSGRPVIHAHHGMGISRINFQRFAEHLLGTLESYAISEDERYAVIARINTYMDDVVTGGVGLGA